MRAEIRDAIVELQDGEGHIRPEDVVDAARSSNHILHPFFDWNDASAAVKHRLDRARQLIREVRVEYRSSIQEPTLVRAYVHDPEAGKQPVYKSVVYLADDRERVRQSLLADLRRIVGYLINVIQLARYWQVDLRLVPNAADEIQELIVVLEELPISDFKPRLPLGGGRRLKRRPRKKPK